MSSQYEQIRTACLKDGRLFEDEDFPAKDRSLYINKPPNVPLIWKRPTEFCQTPKFFSGDINRHDVAQGTLQNCWFVSALATLSQYKSLLYQVCPPHQSFQRGQYCGLFVFRFWRFGEWIDVFVDDRLPTHNGRLYYTKSPDPNEFWSALLEKAYCKLYGPYESLALGIQSEALQDFTGGVIEKVSLTNPPKNLFTVMLQAVDRHSLMGVSISAKPGTVDLKLKNGLIMGHAYSVTGIKKVNLLCYPDRPEVNLIRIRNPWGNDAEWRGPWSDGSAQWKMLSPRQKEQMGLIFEDDGEFWMSMEDFVVNFSVLEVCLLTPDSVKDSTRRNWDIRLETGHWQSGVSAGGCRNFIKYFHKNPQFRVKLEDADEHDEENRCSMIVALMRKDRRRLQRDVPIGFAIYKTPGKMTSHERLDRQFFENNRATTKTSVFTKEREITLRCLLTPGDYVIVPSTFKPNQEADFLLRIFSEKSHVTREVDQKTELLGPPRPKISNFDRVKFDYEYRQFFHDVAGQDEVVDQQDLQHLLNRVYEKETSYLPFSLASCRSMISMFDYNKNGVLEYEEFIDLWMLLRLWQCYDRDNSGDMDIYELREALIGLKFSLSNRALEAVVLRFHNKKGSVTFDMFVQINVRLVLMFETFLSHSSQRKGKATFGIDDFIATTLCI